MESFSAYPVYKRATPGAAGRLGNRLAYTDPASHIADSPEPVTGDLPIVWFVVSTEGQDRDGDIVRANNWDTDNFARNPVWLLDHGENDSRPIGSALHPTTKQLMLRHEDGRVLAGCHFDLDGELGREVYRMVKAGLLRTASIGFLPIKARRIRGGDGRHEIQALELVELTITPTPSNPEAVLVQLSAAGCSELVLKSLRASICDGTAPAATMPRMSEPLTTKAVGVMDDEDDDTLPGEGDPDAVADEPPPDAMPPDEEPVDDAPPVEEAPVEAEMPEPEPHGATVARHTLEHVTELCRWLRDVALPQMEPDSEMKQYLEEAVLPVMDDLAGELHDTASGHYDGVDFGDRHEVAEAAETPADEAAESPAEQAAEDEAGTEMHDEADEEDGDDEEAEDVESPAGQGPELVDDDEAEELAEKYKHLAYRRVLALARKGARMTRSMCKTCTDAADYLHKMADHGEMPGWMVSGHKGHATALYKMVGGGDTEGEQQAESASEGGDYGDGGDTEQKAWRAASAELAALRAEVAVLRSK